MDVTNVTLASGVQQVLACQSENQRLRRELAERDRVIDTLLRRLDADSAEYEIIHGKFTPKGQQNA